jgi:hypothetical protein
MEERRFSLRWSPIRPRPSIILEELVRRGWKPGRTIALGFYLREPETSGLKKPPHRTKYLPKKKK